VLVDDDAGAVGATRGPERLTILVEHTEGDEGTEADARRKFVTDHAGDADGGDGSAIRSPLSPLLAFLLESAYGLTNRRA
jgi:hypothetical protein